MKKIFTILFLLFAFIANAQNTFIINYERSINPNGWMEGAECIDVMPSGDYIIGGGYYSGGGPVLFRLDSQGGVLWDTIVTGTLSMDWRFVYVEVTNDDGFLALDDKGYLYKFNFANTLLWAINTGCSSQSNSSNAKLIETNSGYVLTGNYSSGVCLVKVAPNGTPVFSNVFTNAPGSNSSGFGLKQTSDGGYIISGYYYQSSPAGTFVYLIKTDSAGTLQWAKTYDGTGTYDYGTDVLLADDGGYFICDGFNNIGDVCIIKTDSVGIMQWANKYDFGSYSNAYYLLRTNDNKIIVSGDAPNSLMKIDTNGNWIWSHEYPVGGGKVVRETNDGGFAVATIAPGGYGNIHCFIKTDSLGDVAGVCSDSSLASPVIQNVTNTYTVTSVPNYGTNAFTVSLITASLSDDPVIRTVYCNVTPLSSETILPDSNIVSISPNPTTGIFTIQMADEQLSIVNYQLSIYNVLGETIFKKTVNSKLETVNLSEARSGIYFYKISAPSPFSSPNGGGQEGAGGAEVITGKLIIQ